MHYPPKSRTVAVDFDGVIHSYHKGWRDGSIYGHALPGAKEFLTELIQHFTVVIFSTRCFDKVVDGKLQPNQCEEVRQKLIEWEIPFDRIADKDDPKPLAVLFIDDNAHHFTGVWADNVEAIRKRLSRYLTN